MTEQMIERCLERLATCKTTDVMNFDYAGTLAYIYRLKAENTDLSKRICVLKHALDVCEDLYVMAINGKAFEGLSLKVIMSGLSLHDFLMRWAEESIQQIEKDFAEEKKDANRI